MSEISARYRTIADGFADRAEGIAPDQWSAPTPCSAWTVQDLLVHVIETHQRVIATLDGYEPATADQAGDLRKQWWEASKEIRAALGDEARASKVVNSMVGTLPFDSLVGGLLCADTLIHTWDLARATGQDEQLDADAVSTVAEFLTPLDDAIRGPNAFSAKITPAAGADPQTKLLNFCGRDV